MIGETTATMNCGRLSAKRRETPVVNGEGTEHQLDPLTEGIEQLRDRLARQRDPEDPAVLANRVHVDLDRIHERIRRLRAWVSADLTSRRDVGEHEPDD
jgi:hypothetical protein